MSSKREHTEQSILDHAARLFYEKGFFETSQQEIADAAEVNRGLIHHYFGNKEAIAVRIFQNFLDGFYCTLEQSFLGGLDFIVSSITQGRVVLNALMTNGNYQRFHAQIIGSEDAVRMIDQLVYRDLAKECRLLSLPFSDAEMQMYAMVLASVESRLMSMRTENTDTLMLADIISVYNRIHLSILKIGEKAAEEIIRASIQASDRIRFRVIDEAHPFTVTPDHFELLA